MGAARRNLESPVFTFSYEHVPQGNLFGPLVRLSDRDRGVPAHTKPSKVLAASAPVQLAVGSYNPRSGELTPKGPLVRSNMLWFQTTVKLVNRYILTVMPDG